MSSHPYPSTITYKGTVIPFVPPQPIRTVFLDKCDFCDNPPGNDTSLLELKRGFGYFVCESCSGICKEMRKVYHSCQLEIRWLDLYSATEIETLMDNYTNNIRVKRSSGTIDEHWFFQFMNCISFLPKYGEWFFSVANDQGLTKYISINEFRSLNKWIPLLDRIQDRIQSFEI